MRKQLNYTEYLIETESRKMNNILSSATLTKVREQEYELNIPKNILIFGGGNQATYTIDIIRKEGKYRIAGIIDSVKEIGSEVFGCKVLGRIEDLENIYKEHDIYGGIIALGDNYSRHFVSKQILVKIPNFTFINAIHPSVIVGGNVNIGVGVVAMAGVIFNTNAVIHSHTFFATGCQIEHDCEIKSFASVSAGTVLGGHVLLGAFSALTLNVTVLDRLKIGGNTVVGAGSLVLKDLPNDVLAYGNPCKVIRNRELGEKFLK
jgi:sugar O-acyltransferase (sialic acid O-acetyltransferase NeuD family)